MSRVSLGAFFVSGILMSFLGAVLPSWGYHLRSNLAEVGEYFLSLNFGFLLSTVFVQVFLPGRSVKTKLLFGNALACAGFLFLALFSAPVNGLWILVGLFGIGASSGLLNAGIFEAVSPLYQRDRATATNLAGVIFGIGCLVTALLVWGTYYVYTVPSILILFALLPGFCAGFCAQAKLPDTPPFPLAPLSQVWRDARNPGIVLFTLLLFFQFANEWSVAGWLALFLIRRLGISPETSLMLLALYWAVLLVGRIGSQILIRHVSRALVLLASIVSALLGTAVLAETNNSFGAVMGILFLAAGFAPIFPVVVTKIGNRFPDYHPGLYNGLFSLALTGGLLAPWILGYLVEDWGIQAVMIVPLLGISMVLVFAVLIQLEAKLSGLEQVKRVES